MDVDAVVERLAGQHETPFFVFLEGVLESSIERFRSAFADELPVRVYYSMKTNREPALLRRLAAVGFGVELAAGWELDLAREAGFGRACLDGPYHPTADLARLVEGGVDLFLLDGTDEAARLAEAAGGRSVGVGYRLATGGTGPAEMAHGRFGLRTAELAAAVRSGPFRPVALSAHVGSQMTTARPHRKALRRLARLAADLDLTLDEINLGGGFPSPTLAKTTPLSFLLGRRRPPADPLPAMARSLLDEMGLLRRRMPEVRLGLTPGRALVSQCGLLVSRVRSVKGRWAVTDASRDFLPESLVFARRRIRVPGRPRGRSVHVAGAGLSSADVLGFGVPIGPVAPGDLLVFEDAGAYSLSRTARFTSLTPPAFLVHSDGDVTPIRRGETLDDLRQPLVV